MSGTSVTYFQLTSGKDETFVDAILNVPTQAENERSRYAILYIYYVHNNNMIVKYIFI